MMWKNITIIGTSHIARQSKNEVKHLIENENPDIIAVELDKARAYSLLNDLKSRVSWKDARAIGIQGFFFAKIGAWAADALGRMVGMKPGEEMLAALKAAQEKSIPVAFIDQDIRITLKNLSRRITWKEEIRFLMDILKSPFAKRKIPFDLSTVPSQKIIESLVSELKERYPNVHRVLIEDRNLFMANMLNLLNKSFPEKRIVAVMGAGHVEDVLKLLRKN